MRKARWNLTLPIAEARKNDEVVSLADSQVLRWLDELNGITDADEQAKEIKRKIRELRKEPNSISNRRIVSGLYAKLDALQFKPDYLCLIMDRDKDYLRACKGFKVNGLEYVRLLGTNGGVKTKTIVFVSKRHADEIRRRIDNGRDLSVPMVPAKFEAYKALSCSASVPVSMPNGILVVPDFMTHFQSDIVYLNDEEDGEPVMEPRSGVEIELDGCDGCGMMLPSLAARWSGELGLDYVMSGCNTRFSFEKGMVFTFDFLDFAENVAHSYMVKDAWGDMVDIRQVELVLTTSMLKLWDSYPSCAEYLRCCEENHYTFGIPKTCPKELEKERATNYQFIQSYNLSDEDIDALIKPTADWINGVLHADYAKTILYLKGGWLTEENVGRLENDYVKALMIEPALLDDPYVQSKIFHMIQNRINQAKIGVLNVHGNYSIISGDLYGLCQSMFELPVTGLLKAGEIYNRYWCDQGSESLACFRAPMTCHSNIRRVHPNRSDEVAYWFRHMTTCTVLNAWDTMTQALNGCDFDSDTVMLTDNRILVERLVEQPALMCVQRKAKKQLISEEDAVRANIASFGDDIGKTTNWVTSMFEVQSHFPEDSVQYRTLAYRIQCGQLFQQNAIDKAKGIVAKPMPKEWHDRHAAAKVDDPGRRELYRQIVADKKPYFMRYIYPSLMKQYNTYIENTSKNAMRELGMTLEALKQADPGTLTDAQRDFLYYYDLLLPVGIGPCVMNRICWRFEQMFDGYLRKHNKRSGFDYRIMKSGAEYVMSQYYAVLRLCQDYNARLKGLAVFSQNEPIDGYEYEAKLQDIQNDFADACIKVCQNRFVMCDILLDICYKHNSGKQFVWTICSDEIVANLLKRRANKISFPSKASDGEILFGGERFTMLETEIIDEYYSE